ncbi:ribonuclease HII [Candidatus Saccharibacteria bacterium CG10_big_fil_rev_8_21_14_0_10_47_8]|nr:MAG: ribonuclease HII [Candidatus Saccharibacteria bacterium CG10_big_fil_rev_8_21_14_0_10_47_8]
MIGIDEVGRGAWAGPLLVVAARQMGKLPDGLTDSKLLSKTQREQLQAKLLKNCVLGEGWVTAEEIDRLKLSQALRLGISRALKALNALPVEEIVLDGSSNYVDAKYINARCQVKADALVPIVSAASIHAKITRDKFMRALAKQHPKYGFETHVGYGTKAHIEALIQNGVLSGIHRLSFKPVDLLAGVVV